MATKIRILRIGHKKSMLSSETKRWYPVYSKPQKEKFAQFHLQSKGVEVFLPQLMLPQSQKRHRRVVPLFPSYLFVRIDVLSGESAYVVWSPGVKYLVSFNGVPASIDDEVIDFLKARVDSSGNIQAASNLKPGQRVRVTGGPFEGLEALIEKPPDGKGRVKLLMNFLSRQVQAEIPIRFVESNWVI
jgi:transcriptional antiterminator RfaH